MKVEVVDLWS